MCVKIQSTIGTPSLYTPKTTVEMPSRPNQTLTAHTTSRLLSSFALALQLRTVSAFWKDLWSCEPELRPLTLSPLTLGPRPKGSLTH